MAKVSQRRIAYHRKIWRGRCRVADPDPVFLHGSESGSSDLSEENLKFMTKDRQKMKKATISY